MIFYGYGGWRNINWGFRVFIAKCYKIINITDFCGAVQQVPYSVLFIFGCVSYHDFLNDFCSFYRCQVDGAAIIFMI